MTSTILNILHVLICQIFTRTLLEKMIFLFHFTVEETRHKIIPRHKLAKGSLSWQENRARIYPRESSLKPVVVNTSVVHSCLSKIHLDEWLVNYFCHKHQISYWSWFSFCPEHRLPLSVKLLLFWFQFNGKSPAPKYP